MAHWSRCLSPVSVVLLSGRESSNPPKCKIHPWQISSQQMLILVSTTLFTDQKRMGFKDSCLQLIPKTNGLGLLFKTILRCLFCSLSFIATDGKDGNGLKFEKVEPTFSNLNAISTKNTKKTHYGLLFFKSIH